MHEAAGGHDHASERPHKLQGAGAMPWQAASFQTWGFSDTRRLHGYAHDCPGSIGHQARQRRLCLDAHVGQAPQLVFERLPEPGAPTARRTKTGAELPCLVAGVMAVARVGVVGVRLEPVDTPTLHVVGKPQLAPVGALLVDGAAHVEARPHHGGHAAVFRGGEAPLLQGFSPKAALVARGYDPIDVGAAVLGEHAQELQVAARPGPGAQVCKRLSGPGSSTPRACAARACRSRAGRRRNGACSRRASRPSRTQRRRPRRGRPRWRPGLPRCRSPPPQRRLRRATGSRSFRARCVRPAAPPGPDAA